ncbi:MAG: hypothetical protein A2939_05355 [Parcubacteria group bacterium RIFCSPLOWO2_01_FULL_48_18]|nr:MAG: hypothetical protein A3J67_06615 [Parcubacteria group bacterium RIFCSPHIGHO2_02_FULL_48_10b]OHB22526.1 MAG: hypothetical protein A2939_05355 [Parcubacteria group bacterium RIFCSPLOWO2_01_FULL_48_18]
MDAPPNEKPKDEPAPFIIGVGFAAPAAPATGEDSSEKKPEGIPTAEPQDKSFDAATSTTLSTGQDKPHMLFTTGAEKIKPISESRRPSMGPVVLEKQKKETPKARIELPEE